MNPATMPPTNKEVAQGARQVTGTACVFCNGELGTPDQARAALVHAGLIIAADGGAKHLAALGVKPDVIIGDMDSLDSETGWNEDAVVRVVHPPAKDRSDAELAVEHAFSHGCSQVTLIAAVGKRLDHTLGNIALVAAHPGRVAILDGALTLVAVNPTEKCVLHGEIGTPVSLIPYGQAEVRVRTRGLRYPLNSQPLRSPTHGLSNELSETKASVCVSKGILLVCIHNECPPSVNKRQAGPSSSKAFGDGEKTDHEPADEEWA